ncbi:MAG: hypothetical protein CL755_13530 [Chloroflexi bacterium]|nr:hypothetical protein [Chloroflexota bacterium]MAX59841.1 hypothetical protein [Chloroflexota bacterium]
MTQNLIKLRVGAKLLKSKPMRAGPAGCDRSGYADALRDRDSEDVRVRPSRLAISSELGMRHLMVRVLSRREILKE